MQPKMLLINVEHSQLIVAEVCDARLDDLQFENRLKTRAAVGDVFCGRVQNVVRGLDAAFIDIGDERTALLPFDDIKKSDRIQAGQFLLLQIAKNAIDDKGARLTTQISLPGRFAVLTREAGTLGISQKIKSNSERERLREMTKDIVPAHRGLVVRTEAQHVSADEIAADIAILERRMTMLEEKFAQSKTVGVLHRENSLLNRVARDLDSETSRIVVDAPNEYSMLRVLLNHSPELAQRVELHDDARWIFEVFNVADDYQKAQNRVVKLRSGGDLVFDEAESLTAIDVNTAQFSGKKQLAQTVLQTNLEASQEIARQLSLRNIGGVIVIDFIDMKEESARAVVLHKLSESLKADRARTRIVHFSSLGLLQMTRERRGETLRHALRERCALCDDGTAPSANARADQARRAVRKALSQNRDARTFRVRLPVSLIEAFFGDDFAAIRVLEERWNIEVFVSVESELRDARVEVLTPHEAALAPHSEQRFAVESQNVLKFACGDFVVKDRVLVRLANAPEVARDTTLWFEITTHGRWFDEGRVVLTGLPQA